MMMRSIVHSMRGVAGQSSVAQSGRIFQLRTLYAAEALGVDKYLYTKEKVAAQFLNSADKFKAKMMEFTSNEATSAMIFTDDLKNMAHLVENKPEDIELITKMMKKFNSQNKELRFGNFVFGPVIMRMLYVLKDEEAALRLFMDPDLQGFFDQMMSYQVLMDLLYEKKRYTDVLKVYDAIRTRQIEGARHPKQCMVLVFGACYQENSPDSFKYSTDLWRDMTKAGHSPMRKAATFAAGLALRQNAPHIALEIVSGASQPNYVTVRNIKILALLALNRAEDAIPILRSILEVAPTGNTRQQTVAKDVLTACKKAIGDSANKELQSDFERIEKFLLEHNHVGEASLDEMLTKEITNLPAPDGGNRPPFNRNKQSFDNRKRFKTTQRPGLRDLY